MTGSRNEIERFRFLCDVHVHHGACTELVRKGVDVLHAGHTDLADKEDVRLLRFARDENRILVTRNYRDFVRLVEALAREGHSFPGVLFISPAIRQSDGRAHVRALEKWIRSASGGNPVADGCGWLQPAD